MAASRSAQEDDLDDLDDVLDDFSGKTTNPPATSTSSTLAPNKPVPTPMDAGAANPTATDDFPDPDDEAIDAAEGDAAAAGIDPEMAEQLQKGLASLFGDLGQEGDDEEFKRVMEELMKGDFGAVGGAAGGETGQDLTADGQGPDEATMQQLLSALSMGGAPAGLAAATKGKAKQENSSVQTANSSSTSGSAASAAATPANFQEAIAASMSKMKQSNSTVSQETEAKKAAAGDADPMAAMLSQMAGLGGEGGEEGLQTMLEEMMGQLMSREVLYEPLKELRDKYPQYLKENSSTLSEADLKRFQKQESVVKAIVAKFEEPGADKEPPLSAADEAARAKRTSEVTDLVAEMNDCGAPPKEIMGEMPPGMELGADGMPGKMPEECTIS